MYVFIYLFKSALFCDVIQVHVFRVVTPCSDAHGHQRFGVSSHLHLALEMEVVSYHIITGCHNRV